MQTQAAISLTVTTVCSLFALLQYTKGAACAAPASARSSTQVWAPFIIGKRVGQGCGEPRPLVTQSRPVAGASGCVPSLPASLLSARRDKTEGEVGGKETNRLPGRAGCFSPTTPRQQSRCGSVGAKGVGGTNSLTCAESARPDTQSRVGSC